MDGIEGDTSQSYLHKNPNQSDETNAQSEPIAGQSTADQSQSAPLHPATTRVTRATQRQLQEEPPSSSFSRLTPATSSTTNTRRSTRLSIPTAGPSVDPEASGKVKKKVQIGEGEAAGKKRRRPSITSASTGPLSSSIATSTDRKGKKRAPRSPTPPTSDPLTSSGADLPPPAKKPKKAAKVQVSFKYEEEEHTTSSSSKGKGKAKAAPAKQKAKPASKKMPRKANPNKKVSGSIPTSGDRIRKPSMSSKHLMDDHMDEDESNWVEDTGPSASGAAPMDEDDSQEDEHMDEDDHEEDEGDEDDDEDDVEVMGDFRGNQGSGLARTAYDRIARLASESGMHLDEATAAALFGGEFRSFGSLLSGMSGMATRFKRLKTSLKSQKASTRLTALRECSDILLVSNEDTLGGSFSTNAFVTEFIAILGGKPNVDHKAADDPDEELPAGDDMDEDAQLAAALAMSTGGPAPMGDANQDEMEAQLLACRCLAHLMEALPGSGHTLVHLGAVPVLCSKLTEINSIELAEQTLSTMEKISAEYPAAIVRENGLGALLNFLPFFSTNVQRTAVTAAANCCRNISSEHYKMVQEVFPIIRDVLTQADQRLVEQATLAVVRTIEAYRHNAEHLEGLLDVSTVVAVNALLMPSGGSPLVSASTYTHLLKSLTTSARSSAKVTIAFLEAGMTDTLYQILTGVLPPSETDEEQGASTTGQGLAGGVADMAVMQNLAHRPKEQVEEALALITELLPPQPKDGVFDSKGYTERNLSKIRKGRPVTASRSSRRGSKTNENTTGTSTPTAEASASTSTIPLDGLSTNAFREAAATKAKKEAEVHLELRIELLKSRPELSGKFIKAIVPVLVDVYAASVASRVRTKVLNGLVKAVAFAEPDDLINTLKTVPMASFLGSIISSKDTPIFVLHALQLVELLATKLPQVYQSSFLREGVVFEIEALASEELSTVKAAAAAAAAVVVKTEPGEDAAEDVKPITFKTPSSLYIDPNDANITRARILLAKRIFESSGGHSDAAALVLDELSTLVKRLCVVSASEPELRDTLREIASQFGNVGQALSSFELLKSGLVDGFLEFVDIDGAVASSSRRAMFFDIFSDTTLSTPSPLTMLVKRLHESLGRLENFEVETAFSGISDSGRPSSSSLGKSLRIRLQAEEGQDIPKTVSSLSVTIQAIAPMQALHDYLRPRVADANYMSGSGLSSMFAAYAGGMAIPRPTGAASRILSALGSTHPDPSLDPVASSAPESSSRLNLPAPVNPAAGATPKTSPKVQRRRSARISGQGLADAQPATPVAMPTPVASSSNAILSSSAPEASILPTLPMDMDFDDEGYSDDEYEAEVFEEEMDEESNRPTEKVVNMSVAPDGLRVEAKTPEGTRIATPNQAAQAGSNTAEAGPSRMSSYAGAVKTAPVNWHLEFTLNGVKISLDDTIYGAVHKSRSKDAPAQLGVFGMPVMFRFRKVDGPAPGKPALDAPSPGSVVSALPDSLEAGAPTSKILRLLRVVHNLSVEGRENGAPSDSSIDEGLFVNNKLTAKLTRQLEETMIIASNCLPEWAIELPKHFSFLFPFETRYAFLQSTSFGYGRLISRWQAAQPRSNNRRDDNLAHLARIPRQKVRISRSQLLESCGKVLELYGTSNGILEIEYFDEIGTGLGPTLEFYSLASKEFARKSLKLWRDEDSTKAGNYVHHPKGLYPAPAMASEAELSTPGSRLAYFKTLGLFIGRALLDSRIIDVNLNKVFLKLILGKPVRKNIATLKMVDLPLARSLERLQNYFYTRKEIEALKSLPPSSRRNKLATLTVGGAKLQDLSLDFTLPGYDIELKPGGAGIDVDDSNLEEYIERVLDLTLGSGVSQQAKAFQEGFSMIFPIQDLQIFSPEELGLLFGNADEDWSQETLEQALKADHGYNSESRAVRNLIETMSSYDKDTRREFLQFVTGAPKLPIGGFRGLSPPFTVVRKPHEPPLRADDYLPSVMTCAQYLKMPDYSTKEILAAQIKRAMTEGGGSFHLS
ncbi:E3 ubiquitin-protein ligase TRIP12, partial [Tremellales sp. Uapishka_1]